MATKALIDAVDQEITRLLLVRKLLAGENGTTRNGSREHGPAKATRLGGRPALSAEARERIASAQRKRWAAQRKAAKKAARA